VEERKALKDAYRILFRGNLALEDALAELERIDDANVRHLADFIRGSRRGFTRAGKRRDDSAEGIFVA